MKAALSRTREYANSTFGFRMGELLLSRFVQVLLFFVENLRFFVDDGAESKSKAREAQLYLKPVKAWQVSHLSNKAH